MISKRKAAIGTIVIVLVTSLLTFTVSNKIQIHYDQKVVLPISEFEEYARAYKKYSKVMALEEFVKEYHLYDVSDETLYDGELKGLFESLDDPYSVYMTKDEFSNFMEHTKGTYGGIGIIVTPGDDNLITVVSPIEDTPGEKAGIKTGDKIVKVDGKEFTADKMEDAIKIMKGEPGTDVVLTLMRKDNQGNSTFIDKQITRQEIRLVSIKSQMLQDKIGYIRIVSFDDLTDKDFKTHLQTLQKDGMQGLVIDLRNNPGGLLDVCANIADELMGEGTIVYTETKNKQREYLTSDKKKLDLPLTILINEGSASASEILSGAIQDTKTGVLIGTKTFGKGIVQRIKDLPDGSGFKLTVSEYFTPNGKNIHGKGIEPDIVVEIPEDVEQVGVENIEQDTQLQKAIEVLKSKIK